jgi:hypothetical protein
LTAHTLTNTRREPAQIALRARRAREHIRSPLLIAHTRAAWAALLADRNQHDDHTRARVMAQQALDTATTGGYGYIETDARAVLTRLT